MGLRSDRSDEAEGLRPDACLVISRLGFVGQRVRRENSDGVWRSCGQKSPLFRSGWERRKASGGLSLVAPCWGRAA